MVTAAPNARRNGTVQSETGIERGKASMANVTLEDKGRLKALELTLGQIEKSFGKGAIMRLDGNATNVIEGIPTGALSLDIALGGQGVPRGRIVEIFGPESSGKTTLALSIVASAQKRGGVAAFIDAEHALDPSWAKRIGVNLDEILVSQPDTGEQALEICELLVRSNAVDVVVIDSVAALIPRAEIEGEMGDSHVGLQARLMSQAMRKLTGAIAKSETIVIFINQLREKIGVMFGNPETTPGGRALKFYSSVRIDIRRTSSIKEGEANVGNRVRARVVKNKIAPPFREAEFDIMFNEGISAAGDLLDLAVADEIVEKSGAWFSYKGTRLGQGRENSKTFIRDNQDLAQEIRQAILAKRSMSAAPAGKADAASAKNDDDADDE
jgi:recombination protein RecA